MPFEIVRNDIVNMQVDAIVNTANPKPIVGYGCDAGIHAKAGPQLLAARKEIGPIGVGEVALTPGFDLDAKFVLHAVGPVWTGGQYNEEKHLRQCYDRSLELALEHGCESIAFPLLSAGNHGFPKPLALQIALNAFSSFLMEHEMQIYLVVFSKDAFQLSEKLFHSVDSYIDENYILDKTLDEYGVTDKRDIREAQIKQIQKEMDLWQVLSRKAEIQRAQTVLEDSLPCEVGTAPDAASSKKDPFCDILALFEHRELESLLKETDSGFSETLLKLIDHTGKKDSDIYKKANVDRKLFSKIRNNPNYQPSKTTAIAFALALELSFEETQDFIRRAGYTLTHSSQFDVIVEYFIKQQNYNIIELDATLFHYDLPLIGS